MFESAQQNFNIENNAKINRQCMLLINTYTFKTSQGIKHKTCVLYYF